MLQACTENSPYAGPFLNNAPSLCRAPFEPKGTLSSISAILSVILGVHFGHVLIHMKDHSARLNHWIPTGCALLALGIVLHLSHVRCKLCLAVCRIPALSPRMHAG
ncbi:uncharacterized protein LOC126592702 [Malus sylvestris]|uniref:uncharacterized protein LOC126592702 n=1 Tax=Malus sylvestris TaxID=3752 RepID=UPI0021ABA679|nr:uncharacterized protein LOC126592702 [Malus sylvestris]